jgi:hypothetical protein
MIRCLVELSAGALRQEVRIHESLLQAGATLPSGKKFDYIIWNVMIDFFLDPDYLVIILKFSQY